MIRLIIKGSTEDAEKELKARNIPHHGLGHIRDYQQSIALIKEEHEHEIIQWMLQHIQVPYPIGALLHYQWVDDEDKRATFTKLGG